MIPVSVVIITQNKAEVIASCIDAAKLITDDVIIVDNDSIDDTVAIAYNRGCRVSRENWGGYGVNKNKGNRLAKYDWILSIDADEIIDEELVRALHELDFKDQRIAYDISFKSYFGTKTVNFGSWGRDHHVRLFNRNLVRWSEPAVHETLLMPYGVMVKKLKGYIHHHSVKNAGEYAEKSMVYARLCAEKYYEIGKKATFTKLHIAPAFHFLKNYIFFLGFLDGREGYAIARIIAKNTRMKYRLLQEMYNKGTAKTPRIRDKFVVEYGS
jgi:glycosyltransferase involved in cell wall biosynthesis